MSEEYSFCFEGTKAEFDAMLFSENRNDRNCILGDFVVDKKGDKYYCFGIQRLGHSGCAWYNANCYEESGKTVFHGQIARDEPKKKSLWSEWKINNKLLQPFAWLFAIVCYVALMPVWIYVGINKFLLKMKCEKQLPRATLEERLLDLMENQLHCDRM